MTRYDHSWGATDFFLLPPRAGEVTARIRQATRQGTAQNGEKVLEAGGLRIDLERYEVFNHGRRVQLTFKEYQLLCLLASSPGRVFSRETLLHQIWEYDYFGGTRTVDVHIRRLRSKVEDPGQTYIETVWNVGYRFREQPATGGGGA
ncbi:MAG: response regulator transcription factor [Chloroflexi bacterium]|nr:response regulator transcription factor [Chloroflexota bacterium]